MVIRMDYYFRAEQLSVGYQQKPLLKNIEFGLRRGEILTLIGPNGAGKTTLLRSLARQLPAVSGALYLDKDKLEQLSGKEFAKSMAVVLTEKLRTELMSCEDVVATGRYPYTGHFGILSEEDYAKVQEAMSLVHVTELGKRDFTKISDGQRQRVMLARAICQEPKIILLDEPTSFLDIKYKLEFLSVLQELKRTKELTVIMSLHELELAERVSDKLLCVNGQYAERFGSPEEIFQKDYIRALFDVRLGSYDEESGTAELEPPKGSPDIFVIAGAGSGRAVYRRLQREGKAFVTGIIYENDLDYPSAKALAATVFEGKAFEPADEQTVQKARRAMDGCSQVICCRKQFGSLETAGRELLAYALERGKQILNQGE